MIRFFSCTLKPPHPEFQEVVPTMTPQTALPLLVISFLFPLCSSLPEHQLGPLSPPSPKTEAQFFDPTEIQSMCATQPSPIDCEMKGRMLADMLTPSLLRLGRFDATPVEVSKKEEEEDEWKSGNCAKSSSKCGCKTADWLKCAKSVSKCSSVCVGQWGPQCAVSLLFLSFHLLFTSLLTSSSPLSSSCLLLFPLFLSTALSFLPLSLFPPPSSSTKLNRMNLFICYFPLFISFILFFRNACK